MEFDCHHTLTNKAWQTGHHIGTRTMQSRAKIDAPMSGITITYKVNGFLLRQFKRENNAVFFL
jgi:hypothetical protein